MTSDLGLLRRSVKDPVTGQQLKDDARPDLYAADARRIADALAAAQEEIERLKAEIEAMKNPPEEYCVKCGAPKSNHPFRHQFVARAALGKEG